MNRNDPPLQVLYGGGTALVSAHDGQIHAEELHGLFAGDTRVLSTYRLAIAGHGWQLLSRSRQAGSVLQWDFQNPAIRSPSGDIEEGSLHLRLRRAVDGALHDCLSLQVFGKRRLHLRLTLQIDADFSDVFQVKDRRTPPRLKTTRTLTAGGLRLSYSRNGFRRGLEVGIHRSSGRLSFVGTQLVFDLDLEAGETWSSCLDASPIVDGTISTFHGDPHDASPLSHDGDGERADTTPSIDTDPLLAAPFISGQSDLRRLVMTGDNGCQFVAAGAPWFMALFGRDTLVTSLMSGLLGPWIFDGVLEALRPLQAEKRDDFRDAEPGKLPHELRRGELAWSHEIPHTPYYGCHDAPALHVLSLWNAFRWTGDRELLARNLPVAVRSLEWCLKDGDRDGDGFLEYATRSRLGYRNQGWKDSGEAIVHEDGRLADPPLATVELQGYLYAALLAMAELLSATGDAGDGAGPSDLLRRADTLRKRIEERYWMDRSGIYALALDRDKDLVRSVTSNPGHLLWCGVPSRERAQRLGMRLLQPDLFSGWGLRTLSSDHPAWNPLSYQVGSVWPHDTTLAAAGLMRYGMKEEGARLLEGILQAARTFDDSRLPELYCGFDRSDGPPVHYLSANSPQAWAATSPVLAAQLFLGLLPDVPNRKCFVEPWLPGWLDHLELRNIPLGDTTLDISVRLRNSRTVIETARARSLTIVEGLPEAPLWGRPPA